MADIKTGTPLVPNARVDGDAVFATIKGEIDLHNSPVIRAALFDLLAKHQPKRLVLNLAAVPYMDSSAIAVLVESWQRVRKASGKIYLTNLQPRVKGIIEIARLNAVFVICNDEAEALTK